MNDSAWHWARLDRKGIALVQDGGRHGFAQVGVPTSGVWHRERYLLAVALDITDTSSVDAAVHAAIDRFGRIDVLVNNAGYSLLGNFESLTQAQLEQQVATNFWGAVHVMRAALPVMRRQGGRMASQGLYPDDISDAVAVSLDAGNHAVRVPCPIVGRDEHQRYIEAFDAEEVMGSDPAGQGHVSRIAARPLGGFGLLCPVNPRVGVKVAGWPREFDDDHALT